MFWIISLTCKCTIFELYQIIQQLKNLKSKVWFLFLEYSWLKNLKKMKKNHYASTEKNIIKTNLTQTNEL